MFRINYNIKGNLSSSLIKDLSHFHVNYITKRTECQCTMPEPLAIPWDFQLCQRYTERKVDHLSRVGHNREGLSHLP